mmetsp:Transcript_8854/g.6602  ORF Transcript_8854/g.6602 Transcript_8854/m.6602 type:complete len:126 (+) Transcript_8854:898-1275(+)
MKNKIKTLRLENPEEAARINDLFFRRNEVDEWYENPPDLAKEVKDYPGSIHGPNPEDDPKFYQQWLLENQPKWVYGDNGPNYEDLGVKFKYKVHEEARSTETTQGMSQALHFLNIDEASPMAGAT